MKTLTFIIILLGLTIGTIGCASVSYKTADGTEVSYSRFLTSADSIEAKVGTAYVKANKVGIDAETLQYLLRLINK